MFFTLGAEFFQREFFLVLFFIFFDPIVNVLANRTGKFHVLFGNSSHNTKINKK